MRSLSLRFSHAAKRLWATTLLAGSLLTASGVAAQEKTPTTNEALLEQARFDFPEQAKLPATHYSAYLDSLSLALNSQAKGADGTPQKIIVLDAYPVDVGMALRLPFEDVLIYLLKSRGAPYDAEVVKDISDSFYFRMPTAEGSTVYTQAPFTYDIKRFRTAADPAVLIPASDNALDEKIMGMPQDDIIQLINAHEAAHAIENFYNFDGIDAEKAERFSMEDIGADANIDGLRFMTVLYKREVIADLAALGHMIRLGRDIGIIDLLADERIRNGDNHINLSSPVLFAFKQEIEKMGLKAFRAMPEADMLRFYYDVTERHSVDAKDMKVALHYFLSDDPMLRGTYEAQAEKDPATARGVALGKLLRPAPSLRNYNPMAYYDDPMATVLKKWDPLPLLIRQAQKSYHIVLPATVIAAYGDLMDELAAERRAHPKREALITQKMMKLKSCFIDNLTEIDYEALNRGKGISPEKMMTAQKNGPKP